MKKINLKRNSSIEESVSTAALLKAKVADYKALVKFRLSSTVVFSAVMAYLIAAGPNFSWKGALVLGLGGFLITAAANALNQVLERDYDRLMKRTADRPLAAKRMGVSSAVLFAGLASLAGIVLLALFNPWVPLLGMISLVSYSFVYTPMKRVSPIAVLIGAVPGALPMAIGVVAAQGEVTFLALALFGLQFFWQFPHFWAIAWLGHEDYTRAGFNLLPSKELDANVGLQSLLFTLMLLPILGLMLAYGLMGTLAFICLALASLAFAWFAWRLYKRCDRPAARQLMFASLLFLPVLLTVLCLDVML